MIDKILVKLTGLLLVAVSIILIVKLILIENDYDLVALASYVFLITIIIITLILGIAFLMAKVSKKTTTIKVVEDDRDDEVEEVKVKRWLEENKKGKSK